MNRLTDWDGDPDAMPLEQARARIRDFLIPVDGTETIPLEVAFQRTLAEDVIAPMNVPPHDYSAMDGYALRIADLENGISRFELAGTSYAGHPYPDSVQEGRCIRIMTGALIPEGCDTVVMQEHVGVEGKSIIISGTLRSGQNIRRAGEDLQCGAVVLSKGCALRPAEMGLLASLGLSEVKVTRKLRVAIFSTGDELQQPGQPLSPGQIYDSNRYTLIGMLAGMGVEVLDRGHLPDDVTAMKSALLEAARDADAMLSSGGVSVGEADHIRNLLAEIGEVALWKIAMKPGKPLAFGRIGSCLFFGLPGNPVAVMVTFQQIVRDALRICMGQQPAAGLMLRAICASPIKKLPGRIEFQRGILARDPQGRLTVSPTGAQGSGILSSMSQANCLIVLPESQGNIEVGVEVEVQPTLN